MIITREEFNTRWVNRDFDTKIVVDGLVNTEILYEEIQADAKYRSHEYMFDGSNFSQLPLQEDTVGIKNTNPYIKTEFDRCLAITQEIRADTYEPVEVYQDINHPTIIYIGDGFHRIYIAHQLGIKQLRCKIKLGQFKLTNDLRLRDIIRHIEILSQITGSTELKEYIKKVKPNIDKEYEHGVKFGDIII